MLGINHPLFINMKVKGMVGVFGIMRMTAQRLLPADQLAHILNQHLALGQVLHREHPLAVYA